MGENPFENPDLTLRIHAGIARLRAEILKWGAEPTDEDYETKVTEWFVKILDVHAEVLLSVVDCEALLPEYVERVRLTGFKLLKRQGQPGGHLANPYSEARLREIVESSGFLAYRRHAMSSEEQERWIANEIERARVVLREKIESAAVRTQHLCFRVEARFEARYSHWKAEAIEQVQRAKTNAPTACSQPAATHDENRKKQVRTVIARNLERLREECGWSQDCLAESSKIDKTQVVDHIHGRTKPHPSTLKNYANAFAKELKRPITVADLTKP